jgi:hypothetical protein
MALLSPTLSITTSSLIVDRPGIGPVYSPLSNVFLDGHRPSYLVKSNPPTFVTPLDGVIRSYYYDVDSGLNDSYIVQKDITKGLMYKALDKWLYTEFSHVLKYLLVSDGKVKLVKSQKDADENKVSKDSTSDLELKSDYIHQTILTEHKTKEILFRIIRELGIKWYELPYKEGIVIDVIGKYIKKKLKHRIGLD